MTPTAEREPVPICKTCKVPMVRYAFNRWQYLKMGREEYRCPKCHGLMRGEQQPARKGA